MSYLHQLQNKFHPKPATFYVSLLVGVFVLIFLVNFPWGKWFIGWDNVLPELNFPANIERSIHGLWQENEGLGLMGGHGYAALLLHTLSLIVLSVVVPLQYLRPLWILAMLLIGSVGSFKIATILLDQKSEKMRYRGAFLAGLFYMINFGTVQMFYIPLEAFAAHFAFLPWLLFYAMKVLRDVDRKSIFYFLIFSFLSAPQGFIPPLFAVYSIFLFILCFGKVIHSRTVKTVKIVLFLLGTTFILNAYWLLPVGYYSLFKSNTYLNSYNNLTTTNSFIEKSNKYGNFSSLILLKGFIYEAVDAVNNENIFFIFQPWRNHLDTISVDLLASVFFVLVLVGLFGSLKKGNFFQKTFVILFTITFIFLASDIFPFSFISEIFRNNIPIFHQAFRIAFTKFSIGFSLFYSLFIAIGFVYLYEQLLEDKDVYHERIGKLFFIVVVGLVSYLFFPVFQGHLFYDRIKINLPDEYQKVFQYFQKQPLSGRIANFPQASPTGWSIYRWGYSGSGFLWYGLDQPILDRNFDVWSNYNENYYWEISQAIYSNNSQLFESILKKYQIQWLLVDTSVAGFVSPKSLYLDKFLSILQSLPHVSKREELGAMHIYYVDLENDWKSYISVKNMLLEVGPLYVWNNYDQAVIDYGDYYTNVAKPENISKFSSYYPFRSLFTGRKQDEISFKIVEDQQSFNFETSIPKTLVGAKMDIPILTEEDVTEIGENDLSQVIEKYPQIYLDGEIIPAQFEKDQTSSRKQIDLSYIQKGKFQVRVPKISGYYSYQSDMDSDWGEKTAKNCNQLQTGTIALDKITELGKKYMRLTSTDASNCIDIELPFFSQKYAYLVAVESRNRDGDNLLFSVINKNSLRSDIETYVSQSHKEEKFSTSYFIVPPMEDFSVGYILRFNNISIGNKKTINDIAKVAIHPIPYRFLTSLKIVQGQEPSQSTKVNPNGLEIDHPNQSFYRVNISNRIIEQLNNPILILSQSFDKDWRAYEINNRLPIDRWYMSPFIPLFGKEIKDHVLVNNWENGWNVSNISKNTQQDKNHLFVIIYWPQYVQYFGFFLLLTFPISFFFLKTNNQAKKETSS